MKKILLLLTFCTAVLCASASNKYVKPDGDDSQDGKSWDKALATIQTAVWGVPAGDTIFIAEGTYNQKFSVSSGQTILGGYNAATGERDIELYETIIDGTDIGIYPIVKYDGPPEVTIVIDGITIQNAVHEQWGGGAIYMRDNMVLSNSVIRNCRGGNGGAIYIDHPDGGTLPQAIVRNCVIELCSAKGSAAAIYNKNGIIENTIIRGCEGPAGVINNATADSKVINCLIYNNTLTGTWPNAAVYNKGQVINSTIANNYGDQYPGIHSEGVTINSVFWGNKNPDEFSDPANYINGSGSKNNVADEGFGSSSAFLSKTLAKENNASDGPNFRNPTTFVGAPSNEGEIAAMRLADFSITDASTALLNKGDATSAPATDIDGVARPKGSGIDIGAYEYDPDAVAVAVTGVNIVQDTIRIIKGQSGTLIALIQPADANNKRVSWSIDNTAVATIHNGAVTGIEEGTTVARVETQDGGFKDTAVVVILPVPPVFYPAEVLAADELYKIEDYTIPSFIPFLVAKEAARIDSATATSEELASIPEKIEAMNAAIAKLQGKEEPYNMIANINGDPKTHMAFCWFTNEGISEGKVQIVAKENATAADFSGAEVITLNAEATQTKPLNYAVSTSGIIKAAGLNSKTAFKYVSHKAKAEELTPGTAYSWRVGYEGHWSPIAHFRTQNAAQGEYSFVYMSDSHIQDAEYVNNARWCSEALVKTASDARFCLFPGDFVETGTAQNSEWEWERWFEESIKPVIMQMPIVPTDGNHDDSENLNYTYHFNTDREFNDMAKTKPQFDGITYSFVYGDVLFLVYSLQDWWRASGSSVASMKSTYLSTDVRNWFRREIEKHPNTKYRVTLSHKNIFSGSGHSVDEETPLFRELMLPIFKECEIDLAIQGHDHCYEVIGPVNPDTRMVVEGAVTDVENVPVNTNTNMTGKEGGTYTTDDGTLYFIGATCGRKRYYPYSREKMEANYDKHKVTDYFDLFTGMFGQPEAPSFTRFTVKDDGIEVNSYTANSNGTANLLNTMQIKRNKPHTVPFQDIENINTQMKEGEKFIRNGQLYILKNGRIFNVFGLIEN